MNVKVHYKDASAPIVYHDVENTYLKGEFFVVLTKTYSGEAAIQQGVRHVYKHPLNNIWRVEEDYS